MNIVMVARNCVTIPPTGYGGTERVLYDLAEEYVKLGHNVYLFCKRFSKSSANMIFYPDDLVDDGINDFVKERMKLLNIKPDIIHDNTECLISPKYYKGDYKDIPICFTLHYASRFDYEYKETIYPSDFIKNKCNGIKELDNVVHHGINVEDYKFDADNDGYLLYMGIIKYPKGVHVAIDVAEKTGLPLIIAGPQDDDDFEKTYYKNYVEPHLNDKIQYIGTVSGASRLRLLSKAKALIFPTEIETFGLVSVEAMASGTPVLLLENATSREVLPSKWHHCICKNSDEMVTLINEDRLPKGIELRNHVNSNFSIRSMANKYLTKYKELINKGEYSVKVERAKNSISLCMIAKNEEKNLKQCLDSVSDLVDEIIVVDTGSTDRTKEVALSYGAKVYDFEWIYNFSAARNFSISQATSEYCFFLDCDDMFKEEDREKFKKLKAEMDGSVDLYWMYYDYRHDENGVSNYSFQTERIFRNFRGVKWDCVIHEMLILGDMYGNAEKTDIRITHTSNHDNTDKYLDFFSINEERGHVFNQREKFFYSMELFKHKIGDKCYNLVQDIINDDDYYNMYEKSAACGMAAAIDMERGEYNKAIKYYLLAGYYHQPLPYNYYSIGECYRAIGRLDHALFYYNTLLAEGTFFREKFSNESVYCDFDSDLRTYSIKALLSMIIIYYDDYKDIEKSEWCNNRLLELDPENESGLYNKLFFDSLKEQAR